MIIAVKYICILIVRKLSLLLHVLPIKKKQILFYSFAGKQYSDSPKYIAEYIEQAKPGKYQIVWALNDINNSNFATYANWKTVKYRSFSFIICYVTSSVIVTNLGPFRGIERRKGQTIINTWHGGGAYKMDGVSNPYKKKFDVLYNSLAMKDVSLFISSSDAFKKYCIQNAYLYKGQTLDCGMPRNDILFEKDKHTDICVKVRQYFNISEDYKIALYAPTWRNYDMSPYDKLNFSDVIEALQKRFNNKWVFICRAHNLTNDNFLNKCNIFDGTIYPDMQELLIASDLLITDYSSCMWDYSLTNKFALLYTPDLEKYKKVFGFSTPITKWGFEICQNNKEVIKCILDYDEIKNMAKIEENHKYYGMTETGKACEQILKYIESKENKK